MNMFKGVKPTNVEEYLAAVEGDRKEIIDFLHDFIMKSDPMYKKPWFAYNMIGYGRFEYTNYKKEKGDWPVVALANQKSYVSIYVCGLHDGEYVAEKFKDELGKVSVGKSCIRTKKLENIDLKGLKKVLKIAAKSPGLVAN